MKILITNDDGIYADGINTLVSFLLEWGQAEVIVVAPDRPKSASSHYLTLDTILRLRKVRMPVGHFGYVVVDGSPADCVLVALHDIAPDVDFVLSGINHGANTGVDVLYSGTVAAAAEAVVNGKPAVAISSESPEGVHLATAAQVFIKLLDQGVAKALSSNWVLNINVPSREYHELKGLVWAPVSRCGWANTVQKRENPRGQTYYWITGERIDVNAPEGTDTKMLAEGYVTLTPLGLDLTKYDALKELSTKIFFDL
ncbi:5'/3'-nucleotidase SurE [Coprothermobacteraceae bacterium]|nr:5'/3'-nucleotidase SurE [Coprothermobacteraceae bacterium]